VARLLLIEDDADIRTLLERFLKRQGFTVVTAQDGETAVRQFEQATPDVVLVDGLLPKKNGFEVVAAIRKHPAGVNVGVVMMSAAFKSTKSRKEADEAGVDAFFAKPFNLTDLKEKLVELLVKQGKKLTPPVPPVETPRVPRPAPPPAKAEPALPNDVVVSAPIDVSRALLTCARARLTGVMRLQDGASVLQIAFLRGVVVGASDNLREHLLGERLWKQGKLTTDQMRALNTRMAEKGERVAEALLALGLCKAEEALAFVEEQAIARVKRALTWTGTVFVDEDEDAAHRLATSSIEIVDVILSWGLEQGAEADRFVASQRSKKLERAPTFDDLLMILAQTKPDSRFPGALLAGAPTVAEAAAASSSTEVFAAYLASLVRLPDDPPFDPRPVPDVLRGFGRDTDVDNNVADLVCELVLKFRGRTAYEIVSLPRDAKITDVYAALKKLDDGVGPYALKGVALGPATAAARELWTLLDELLRIFSDPGRRAAYDAQHQPRAATARDTHRPEDAFLEGQAALALGDVARALRCFESAAAARPKDPDYASYWAWAQILSGDKTGVQRLVIAMREHPQSMRPLFFLGLCSARDGDVAKARALLEEASRRAPGDVEVAMALSSVN
jgi:DNA-binding response OmpR family regulator